MWGAGPAVPGDRLKKNAFRAGDIFGARRRAVVAGTCWLRQGPKGRSRSGRTAGPDRRDRRRGPARPSRPVGPARAARRAGTTQPKLARHSQTMPDRKLRRAPGSGNEVLVSAYCGPGEIRRHSWANAGSPAGSRRLPPARRWSQFAWRRRNNNDQCVASATPSATKTAAAPFFTRSRRDNVSCVRCGNRTPSAIPNAKTNNVVVELIACTMLNGANISA